MGKGSGFGKTVLVGDAFIHFGVPAIVAAITQRTEAEVHRGPGGGWTLEDERPEVEGYKQSKLSQQRESVDRVIRAAGVDGNGLKIKLGGDLLAGSGIGASAAGCVALARALDAEFGLGMGDAAVNRVAFEGEKAYHGDPGGVDNTASTYGGTLWFEKDLARGTDIVEKIEAHQEFNVVLANSGVNVDTAKVVAYKKGRMREDPEPFEAAFRETREQAALLKRSLEEGDLKEIGRIMDAHHRVLRNLHFSHEKIEEILKTARSAGALGAKVTGGGMGGYALVLAEDGRHAVRIAEQLEGKGFRTLKTTIAP